MSGEGRKGPGRDVLCPSWAMVTSVCMARMAPLDSLTPILSPCRTDSKAPPLTFCLSLCLR